jgi:hypothetical protein
MNRPASGPASVLHIAYDEEHYADAEDAIAGMRERMWDGWRVAVIRGPSTGPFAVVYQREVRGEC